MTFQYTGNIMNKLTKAFCIIIGSCIGWYLGGNDSRKKAKAKRDKEVQQAIAQLDHRKTQTNISAEQRQQKLKDIADDIRNGTHILQRLHEECGCGEYPGVMFFCDGDDDELIARINRLDESGELGQDLEDVAKEFGIDLSGYDEQLKEFEARQAKLPKCPCCNEVLELHTIQGHKFDVCDECG